MAAGVIIDTPPAGNLASKVFVVWYFDVVFWFLFLFFLLSLPLPLPLPSRLSGGALLLAAGACEEDEAWLLLPLLSLLLLLLLSLLLLLLSLLSCRGSNGASSRFAMSKGSHPDGHDAVAALRRRRADMRLLGRMAAASNVHNLQSESGRRL